MKTVLLIAAISSWPAFQPEMSLRPSPLLWETPVSFSVPAPAPPPGLVLPSALTARIKVARDIQSLSGAAEAAASLKDEKEAVELILLRAALLREAGQLQRAAADYKKILASKNRGAPRALALEGYKDLLKTLIAAGEKDLYWDLIKCLLDEWRNEEALALLPDVWGDPLVPEESKKRIAGQEPIMALRLGQYERAVELWAEAKGRSEIQWLAQAENRRGDFLKAAELRENLASKMAAGKARNKELETAWTILAKAALYDEAEALAGRHPELKKLADYNWYSGLAALAADRLPEAEAAFEAILVSDKGHKRQPGARYFLARTQERAGRTAEAAANYHKLASGPFSYYQILAQGRLAPGMIDLERLSNCLICLEGSLNQKGLQAAEALARLLDAGPEGRDRDSQGYYLWVSEKGLSPAGMDEAAGELAGLKGPILAGGKNLSALNGELKTLLAERNWGGIWQLMRANPEALRAATAAAREAWPPLAAAVAAREGDYRLAVSLMSRIPDQEPKGLKRWSHPMVYGREIRQAYRFYGLSPSLMLALIRTESAYQADIMSASNARGLMQLLPATANKVADALGEEPPGALDLFDPAVNIRYGSWYLKALTDGFGSVELALAGYNGGPYNIKSLILAKEGMPLDIFIETISFEETSRYVKRITESRYIYEMVYLGRARLPDLTGPVRQPETSLPDF